MSLGASTATLIWLIWFASRPILPLALMVPATETLDSESISAMPRAKTAMPTGMLVAVASPLLCNSTSRPFSTAVLPMLIVLWDSERDTPMPSCSVSTMTEAISLIPAAPFQNSSVSGEPIFGELSAEVVMVMSPAVTVALSISTLARATSRLMMPSSEYPLSGFFTAS